MGVQVGFRSRNDDNTLRPRRMSKLRFNGRSPLTGHRKPAQAHKRCRVIAASAVARLGGCLPPDLVRARVSSDRRCSAATPSSCRTAARRHPQPLSGLAVIPSGTLTTVEPGLIRIDPVFPGRGSLGIVSRRYGGLAAGEWSADPARDVIAPRPSRCPLSPRQLRPEPAPVGVAGLFQLTDPSDQNIKIRQRSRAGLATCRVERGDPGRTGRAATAAPGRRCSGGR